MALEEENDLVRKRIAEVANDAYNNYNVKKSKVYENLLDDIIEEGKVEKDTSSSSMPPTTIITNDSVHKNVDIESQSMSTIETSMNTNKSTSAVSDRSSNV